MKITKYYFQKNNFVTQFNFSNFQGIRGDVKLQTFHPDQETFDILSNWTITGYPFDNYAKIEEFILKSDTYEVPSNGILKEGPVIFHQKFFLSEENLGDTYWDTQGWGKGFIFINGFNLGRYWPLVGPQITIYVPKNLLKPGWNDIVIVEYQKTPKDLIVKFTDKPNLDN